MNVPPVAGGALLWAADELLTAGDVDAAVGADEVPCDDVAAGLLDVVPLAAGFEDEHATRLAITATDNAVVLPTRRPIVDVFTDFLPRLGFVVLAQRRCVRHAAHDTAAADCDMIATPCPNRFANRFDRR
ncbi:MAG TPA: hypothetical protein VIJ96_20075 [Acidothermaceae bacterium]